MKKDNLIFVEEAMKFSEVIKLVSRASERMWHKVKDVTSFEYTCYRNIGKALATQDVRSVGGIASRIIAREEAWHVKNRGYEQVYSIESLAGLDEDGEDKPFEIEDVLADVESQVVGEIRQKEIATYLAEGDDFNWDILNAWTNGYNDSEISRVLADSYGGKSSVHRIAVQRFRNRCKKRLNVA